MSSHLIIVDKSSSFKFDRTDLEVLTTKDYIARPELVRTRNPKIVNLSRAYSYLGAGYYCSLLAEARSHKVIPSVKTILDLSRKSIYRYALAELEELLKRRVHKMAQPPEGRLAHPLPSALVAGRFARRPGRAVPRGVGCLY